MIKETIFGQEIVFETGDYYFSPKSIDKGTRFMLSKVQVTEEDNSVAKAFIEDGYKHLALGGRLVMVTKRLTWYRNKLTSVFGGVRVFEEDGYYVFVAEKRMGQRRNETKNQQSLSKKLMRKYVGKKRKA